MRQSVLVPLRLRAAAGSGPRLPALLLSLLQLVVVVILVQGVRTFQQMAEERRGEEVSRVMGGWLYGFATTTTAWRDGF